MEIVWVSDITGECADTVQEVIKIFFHDLFGRHHFLNWKWHKEAFVDGNWQRVK